MPTTPKQPYEIPYKNDDSDMICPITISRDGTIGCLLHRCPFFEVDPVLASASSGTGICNLARATRNLAHLSPTDSGELPLTISFD